MTVAAYQLLADAVDCPLHLGVTEAGALRSGTIKSAIGMGSLLWAGIGDTIRVSLAADPVEEIKAGFDILKSLGLRHRGVNIIACPSCARQGFNVIETVGLLEERLKHISTPMSLSIIGCVVNGPGEALMTDVGFTGGGAGSGMVYVAGRTDHKMDNAHMVDHIVELMEAKAAEIEARTAAELACAQAAE
jgi:(E)-4-hydroxy-3-methylbut-2-enyl-diphosphate synthase